MTGGERGSDPREPAEETDKRLTRASGRSILIGIIGVAVFLYAVRIVLLPFVLAGAAAYAISPAVDWLTARAGGRRWVAALVVFLIVVALVGAVGLFLVPSAAHSAVALTGNTEKLVERMASALMGGEPIALMGRRMTPEALADGVVRMASDWFAAGSNLLLVSSWVFSIGFGVVLTLVVFIYFVASGPSVGRGLFRLIPPAQRGVCEDIWALSGPILRRYFIGIACVVLYASVAAYVGLGLFLGLPDAVLLAIISGLLEMVPVLGPIAAAIIAGLAAVDVATGPWAILSFVFYAIALRISIDELVGPIVLGKAGRIHPTVVIFCFLSGGILFGVTGLIMAVPVALVIRVALAVLYQDAETEKKLGDVK